jgi:uncharacterized protein YciI
MKNLSILVFAALLGGVVLSSCNEENNDPGVDPPDITHYTVKFGAGDNWNDDQSIAGQDLGDHFNYQIGLFSSGTLKVAGFLLETDEARYFQGVTTEDEINQIIADDPAVEQGILAAVEIQAIATIVQQVVDTAVSNSKEYYLVEYTPGAAWESSRRLWEQDLTQHETYVGGRFADGFVLRGIQYLNVDKAGYMVLADNRQEVEEFVANDPAVASNIFAEGTIVPYTVNVEQL